MAYSPITSWQIEGEKVEAVRDFIFSGSKIIADVACSHDIKRWLLLERKAMTNLDSILKSRVIILPTKVHIIKAMLFPIVMDGCESWTMKKAEFWRTDAFELWCWRRLLRVPWTTKRSNQWILKEINLEYSLEGLKLQLHTLATCCEEQTHWKRSLYFEGVTEAKGRRRQQRMRWLHSITNSMDMNLSKCWKIVRNRRVWHVAVHRVARSQIWLRDLTTTTNWN